MAVPGNQRAEIWRTDASVLVVRATGVPRQAHKRRSHRLVVLKQQADRLLDSRLIHGGLGGVQGQSDASTDHRGGARSAR